MSSFSYKPYVTRRAFAAASLAFAGRAVRAQSSGGPGIRSLEGSVLESFPDGSTGRISEFRGADGTMIAAFVRKPKGSGPFPAVMILHGGAPGKEDTYTVGRTRQPGPEFVAEGWALIAIDYRSEDVPLRFPGGAVTFPRLPPIEVNDVLGAIEQVRRLPFVDGSRIAVMGGSHGGNVMSRVISRTNLRGGIICSPAIFDPIELWKALERKVEMVQPIKNKIAECEQKYGGTMDAIARNPEAFGYQSPMTETPKVRCPVLIINGRNDTSSPPSVMEVWAERLRAAGKEVETYMPDNAPHGFYFGIPKPLHPETDEAVGRSVAFIRKHFKA